MTTPGFADADDLKAWASTPDGKVEFPQLLRRLVLETVSDLRIVHFPAGAATGQKGVDGQVEALSGNAFVPAGRSVWEASAHSSPGTKADDDYVKRTTTPDGAPTTDWSYVQAILRPWQDGPTWAATKRQDGRWADVRGYNIETVATWLGEAPATHAWLSDHLPNLSPHGYRAAEVEWRLWSVATNPATPTALVLAGRGPQRAAIVGSLARPSSLTTISDVSVDDARAFIAAVLEAEAAGGNAQFQARAVFVDTIESWRSLSGRTRPLILIPVTDEVATEAARTDLQGIHHVLLPLARSATADVTVGPLDAKSAREVLIEAGVPDNTAYELAGLARRSLVALRRRLAVKPELHQPPWSRVHDRRMRGMLLAGAWVPAVAGDQEILASLTGDTYEQLEDPIIELAAAGDPLIAKVDRSFALLSETDAWLQLSSSLSEADLERFADALKAVLLEADPAASLPPERRWQASFHGLNRKYSQALRDGLITSLALLGTVGAKIRPESSTGSQWAEHLVRTLLTAANEDTSGDLWRALAEFLPRLAEAGPEAFVEQVQVGLDGDAPLAHVFDFDGDALSLGPTSQHHHLLWALESLAWSDDHLGQSVDLLCQLTEIDPGGKTSNRPLESLKSIFFALYPATSASMERRFTVLDSIIRRHSDVARKLLPLLLPRSHESWTTNNSIRFRDWGPGDRPPITWGEVAKATTGVVERLIDDAREHPDTWLTLVEAYGNLPPNDRTLVCEALIAAIAGGLVPGDAGAATFEAVRKVAARHRTYQDTDWALSEDDIALLEAAAAALKPESLQARVAWLFTSDHIDLGDETFRADWEGTQAALAKLRDDAVAAIEAEGGLPGVMLLAAIASEGLLGQLGASLARTSEDRYLAELLPTLASEDRIPAAVTYGWVFERSKTGGWGWTDRALEFDGLSAKQKALLLRTTWDFPTSWERAAAAGPEIEEAFWRSFGVYGLGGDFEHVELVTRKFLSYNMVAAAVSFLSLYGRDSDGEYVDLIIDTLDAFLAGYRDDAEAIIPDSYTFEHLLGILQQFAPVERAADVGRLEFAYLPALGFSPSLQALPRAVAEDPEFFIQLIDLAYAGQPGQADSDDSDADAQEDPAGDPHRLRSNALSLLENIKKVPGVADDDTVDGEALNAWVESVRTHYDGNELAGLVDTRLGQLLSYAPNDPDGSWPARPVRDLIERLRSVRLERGMQLALINRQGVTMRALDAGGGQERTRATTYRDQAALIADDSPRTAAVLRAAASSFDDTGRRIDDDAERTRQGRR